MLSPAQPASQPSPAFPGKKCIILSFIFHQKYSVNVKLYCSKIEKIKLFSDQRYPVNVYKMLVLFSCFFPSYFMLLFKATWRFKYPRRDFHFGFTIIFWWKFMIFDNFSMKIDYKKSTRRYVNWNFHVRYDFS